MSQCSFTCVEKDDICLKQIHYGSIIEFYVHKIANS